MQLEWLDKWVKMVGEWVRMPSSTSTSKMIEVGLNFTKCIDPNEASINKSVLFVFIILNKNGFEGFHLSNKNYSAYPHEQEYLLMEGIRVKPLKIEPDVVIRNTHNEINRFNGKVITIVYLFSGY